MCGGGGGGEGLSSVHWLIYALHILKSCNKSSNKLCRHCLLQVVNKFRTTLLIISDLSQGCCNKSGTIMILNIVTAFPQPCNILFVFMTVLDLLKQPCSKSDNDVIKLLTACSKQVTTNAEVANTTCWQLVFRVATTFYACKSMSTRLRIVGPLYAQC